MNTLTIKHMTYIKRDFDTFDCKNALTGKTWTVCRKDNPLAWADIIGKFTYAKDYAAMQTDK